MPVAAGAKKDGLIQTIIGVALIGIGMIPGNPAGSFMIQAGAAMAIGGAAQMLSPTPNTDYNNNESPDARASYLFNGPVNAMEPGTTIPVGYGEMFIGTVTVSGGISVEDVA